MATHRILLVDDDAPTRELFTRVLTQAGHDVVAASTVPHAEALLAETPPDLLITDVRMDGYNGLQLVARAPAECPAIVITGFIDAVLERDARRLGADCLVKPIPSATMLAAVERALRDRVPRPVPNDRRERRTALPVPLDVTTPAADGQLLTISSQGAQLVLKTTGPVPDPLTFTIPSADATITSRVTWTQRHGSSTRCGLTIDPASEAAWRGVVGSLQK